MDKPNDFDVYLNECCIDMDEEFFEHQSYIKYEKENVVTCQKRPTVISAIQVFLNNNSRLEFVKDWTQGCFLKRYDNWYIKTPNGFIKVNDGDYIVRGIMSNFYIYREDIFLQEFEEI